MADQNLNSTSRENQADDVEKSDNEISTEGQLNAAETEASPQVQVVAPETPNQAKPPTKHEISGKRKPPEKRRPKYGRKYKRSKSSESDEELENGNEEQFIEQKRIVIRRLWRDIARVTKAYRCCLCKVGKCEIVFIPCQHLICCDKCSLTITVCPSCDKCIRAERRVYIS